MCVWRMWKVADTPAPPDGIVVAERESTEAFYVQGSMYVCTYQENDIKQSF